MGPKVMFMPINCSQKLALPQRLSSLYPKIFGHQK